IFSLICSKVTESSLKSTLISSLSTSISIEEIPSSLLTLFSTLPAQQLHVIPSTFNVSFIIHNLLINFYLYTTIPLRSEEHTSELQSRFDLVCRLLLEKKKNKSGRHECQRTRHTST